MRRVRDGRLAPAGNPVSARHAEDIVRSVGQAFAALGTADPRKHPRTGKTDFRLARQERAYKKLDKPTPKKLPIPKEVLHKATQLARARSVREQAIDDLMWIGFFFLLRPSEYLWTTAAQSPFTLADITFKVAGVFEGAATISMEQLAAATMVGFNFTEQKNGIKNETICLTRSGEPHACPVRRTAHHIRHLRTNLAPADTPIFTFYENSTIGALAVSDRMITHFLRKAASCTPYPGDYTVGALRNTGAQNLLEAGVPKHMIQLIGRWRSDEIFRYLTARSETLMQPYAEAMISPPATPRPRANGT
jgi:hypothetical protein